MFKYLTCLILALLYFFPYSAQAEEKELSTKVLCRKYAGKLIAFYGQVYFVKNCKRHFIDSDEVLLRVNKGLNVNVVESVVIRNIPEGKPFAQLNKKKEIRDCKNLAGQYITYSFSNIFYVSKCQKRRFVDWYAYDTHRVKSNQKNLAIITVSWEEFIRIPEGPDMPVDSRRDLEAYVNVEEIDVLPLDEACAGVNNKFVSYFSSVYKIENCRKRLVDAQKYSRILSNSSRSIKELSSEQWISIPDGKPLEL